MYKNYKHKLNMLGPGNKIIMIIVILLFGGLLFHIVNIFLLRNVLLICAGILTVIVAILLIVEQHQDKVLNEQAIRIDQKLEAGVKKKSFALFYNGGEIWCEHLDSLGDNRHLVHKKFKQDLEEVKKVSTPSYIIVNLDETLVDREILETILYSYRDIEKDIKKVVIVGLSVRNKRLMNKIVKESEKEILYIVTCVNDFEKAKEWLV
jgi:hypothetical protein